MAEPQAAVSFSDLGGRLKFVEIRRRGIRPLVSGAQTALLALGIVVTSYQVRPSESGLSERFELSKLDGGDLDEDQSSSARSVLLPLALVVGDESEE